MTGKCPARLNLTNYLPGRPDTPSQPLRQPRIEGFLPPDLVDKNRAAFNPTYAAMIETLDRAVGRLLALLRDWRARVVLRPVADEERPT